MYTIECHLSKLKLDSSLDFSKTISSALFLHEHVLFSALLINSKLDSSHDRPLTCTSTRTASA